MAIDDFAKVLNLKHSIDHTNQRWQPSVYTYAFIFRYPFSLLSGISFPDILPFTPDQKDLLYSVRLTYV